MPDPLPCTVCHEVPHAYVPVIVLRPNDYICLIHIRHDLEVAAAIRRVIHEEPCLGTQLATDALADPRAHDNLHDSPDSTPR